MAERLQLQQTIAGALATKGAALLEGGRTTEGTGLLRASLAMADEHGLVVPGLRARNSLAVALLADDPRAAFELAGVGLDVARRLGLRDILVRLVSNWAEAALEIGDWDRVLQLVAELDREDLPLPDQIDLEGPRRHRVDLARRSRRPAGSGPSRPGCRTHPIRSHRRVLLARRSMAHLALGRPIDALADAEATTPILRPTGLSTSLVESAVLTARAALWAGDVGRLRRALDEVKAYGAHGRWLSAMVGTMTAGLTALTGDLAGAGDRYAAAAAACGALDVPLPSWRCVSWKPPTCSPRRPPSRWTRPPNPGPTLEGLRATALIDRLDRGPHPNRRTAPALSH